jgi:kinetochore protein Spc7/SPC105
VFKKQISRTKKRYLPFPSLLARFTDNTYHLQPPISIAQFFDITGIKFMDELDAPRGSIHQPSRQARPPSEIPLAEYAVAMSINVPELVLYTAVSNDLQGWMDQSKAVFAQTEEEAVKVTPELFSEYIRADEEGQAELLVRSPLLRSWREADVSIFPSIN